MKLILRLGLILFTGFISISTASAQLYGTADTNAPELRVPTSVKPAFDYWMWDTWATLGPDGYYYITGTTSTPTVLFRDRGIAGDWNDGLYLLAFQRYEVLGSRGKIWSMEERRNLAKERKYIKQERNIRRNPSTVIRWTTASMQCGLRKCIISKARRMVYRCLHE